MISNNTYFKQIEPELRKPLSNHIFNRDFKKNTNEPQPFFPLRDDAHENGLIKL